MHALRSLFLAFVLSPFLLTAATASSPTQEVELRGKVVAIEGSESSSWWSEHRRDRHAYDEGGKRDRDHDHGGRDEDKDHDRARPVKARLKVKNLTRDRNALNWIKLDAHGSKGRDTRIVEYEFVVTLKDTGKKVHAPGGSASPIAHVRLQPGRYIAYVKVKDARGASRVKSRRFRIRGKPIEDFDITRVEWGLGKDWRVGDPSTLIAIPGGPIDYEAVAGIFVDELSGTTSNRGSVASSGGCGSTLNDTSSGLFIASGAFSFIPGAGPVLGIAGEVVGMSGSAAASACTQNEINIINDQLAYQERQIEQIEKYMVLGAGQFYSDVVLLFEGESNSALNTYSNHIGEISDCTSEKGFASFMAEAGLWTTGCPATLLSSDPKTNAENSTIFKNLKTMSGTVPMFNLPSVTSTYVDPACESNPYQCVAGPPAPAGQSADLTLLYAALWSQLKGTYLMDVDTNLVPIFDSYNTYLVSYYQQSLYALQQGFMMEWYVNLYNYYAAGCPGLEPNCANPVADQACPDTNTVNTQDYATAIDKCFHGGEPIPSMGRIVGTSYPPATATDISTPAAAAAAFNEAQKQLALLYAARINRLYLNTLNYIISDAPIPPQAYPQPPDVGALLPFIQTWPHAIDFEGELGISLGETTSPTPVTPLLQVTAKTGTPYAVPGDPFVCAASDYDDCTCDGSVFYGKKYVDSLEANGSSSPGSGTPTSFSQMVSEPTFDVLDGVTGTFACAPDTFGSDPAPDIYKHCYCRPSPKSWTSDLVLYQFSMQDPYRCNEAIAAFNELGVAGSIEQAFANLPSTPAVVPSTYYSCPPIFSLADGSQLTGGWYDGSSLQAYSYSVSPGGSDSCPDSCSTAPAGEFTYTCGGVPLDPSATPGDYGSSCDPESTSACQDAQDSCIVAPTGALEPLPNISETWDVAGQGMGNGSWAETCVASNGQYSFPGTGQVVEIPTFTGTPYLMSDPPRLCTSCTDETGGSVFSCASCASAQWTNDDGTLICAPPEATVCRGFAGDIDGACGDATYTAGINTAPVTDPAGTECAGSNGAAVGDPVCCGQSGYIGASVNICPEDYPACVGFIQDVSWGTCHSDDETFTDCTQCGGDPVLGLSAFMNKNVGLCEKTSTAAETAASPVLCGASESDYCTCSGDVYYGKKYVDSLAPAAGSSVAPGSGPIATFAQMIGDPQYWVEPVSDGISCSNDGFGIDAAVDFSKQCYCVPGGQLTWYRPPVRYSGNGAGLRGELPYLSCANWALPKSLNDSTCGDSTCEPTASSANTPISNSSDYHSDQRMVGTDCKDANGALAETEWSCRFNSSESSSSGVSAPTEDGTCSYASEPGGRGEIDFSEKIKPSDSESTIYYAALRFSRVNAATERTAGGLQIPIDLTYQCSQDCPGMNSGTSNSDHNQCLTAIALSNASIAEDGYACEVNTGNGNSALTCTLVDGQEIFINLTTGEEEIFGYLEVGQGNGGCPNACSECASGVNGLTPGGQALVGDYCTGFCSGWGYCGDSNYNVANGSQPPIDCRQCPN